MNRFQKVLEKDTLWESPYERGPEGKPAVILPLEPWEEGLRRLFVTEERKLAR